MNIINWVGHEPIKSDTRPPTRAEYAASYNRPYIGPIGIAVHHYAVDVNCIICTFEHHISNRGWPSIGYEYIIQMDGTINRVASAETATYHVATRNDEIVGWCFTGDLDVHHPTDEQIAAYNYLYLQKGNNLPVKAHKEWATKDYPSACPGRYWDEWKHKLLGVV